MKKLTSVLLVVLMVVILALSVSAAEESIVWDFSNPDDVAKWTPSKTTNVAVSDSGALISGEGNDINLTYTADMEIMLQDYMYFVVEYAGATRSGGFQFYHWTEGVSGNPRLDGSTKIGDAETVMSHKFDLTTPPATASWSGKVTKLRVDPVRGSDPREIIVKSVGLYKDKATYEKSIKAAAEAAILPGQPVLLFNPGAENVCFPTTGSSCFITFENNYAVINSLEGPEEGNGLKGDPNFSVGVDFDGDTWHWMKVRLRNLSDATRFEMHFASEGSGGKIVGATCTQFPITSKDADFVEYVIDLKKANLDSQNVNAGVSLTESVWKGLISTIRFDCMWMAEPSGQMPTGSQMYIDYVAFFRSEEDAKNYVPDPSTEIEQPKKNTGAANPVWIFDNEAIVKNQSTSGSDVMFSGGMMRLIPTNSDPMITLQLTTPFDSAEFPIFAYRHSTTSTVGTLGVFYSTDTGVDLSDSYSPVTITRNGTWSNTIVDLSDTKLYPKDTWSGNIVSMRIDPINGNDTNATIYIDRMGFFRTKSEALKFLSQGRSGLDYNTKASFKDTLQTSLVPANTLYDGYNEAEFLLSSTTPVGTGTNPVVMRTKADGTQEIVALGYTNPAGYTTFVANKPANYSLGYSHKEYSDIAGHWGESYINFVSDRTLFGGTSPTEFSPEDTMTRGMFVTVLGRMHGVDTSKYDGNTGYGDVPATMYYAPYIQWAKEYGLMPGLSDVTFGAEDPIYRETMAAVIDKYLKVFDYFVTGYSDVIDFSDLAGVDAATVEAIKSVQKLGIINGKGGTIFDPKGLSTRAEVATVMERTIKTALGVNTAPTQYDAAYFNRDHIKIGVWGFVSNFGDEFGMTKLRDLGVNLIVTGSAVSGSTKNTVFNYADKYGIAVHANDFGANKATLEDPNWNPAIIAAEYSHHPSFTGHHFTDEPGTDSYPVLGALSKRYHEFFPDKMAFVNLLPMYANSAQLKKGAGAAAIEYYDPDPNLYRKYCQQWFEYFDADYICTDIYPLHGSTGRPETWSTYKDYCESINQIATVARENDAEFWCCIQTWGWNSGKRNPTEAEYRWQCYAMLSYGCTGILLWSLNSSNEVEFPSIFNKSTGDVTQPLYDDCAKVMWEMRNLSDVYVQYKNLGAFTINCTSATPWLKMSGEYENFGIISETVSDEPLLIGCFEKKEGTGYAFTVVNMTDIVEFKPATLKFKIAQPLTVTLYDEAVPTTLTADANGYYTISLETTDGVFVTVG